MLEKLLKVLKNYQKNVFSSVPFKKFEVLNTPTNNYRKTDSATIISFVRFENLEIGLTVSVVESHLSKVTETFGFCREI